MKSRSLLFLFVCLPFMLALKVQPVMGQTATPSASAAPLFTPTPDPTQAIFEEKKRELELQRLELENEKLKLEMEQLRSQATKTTNAVSTPGQDLAKENEGLQREMSNKAEALSKENKDKTDLLILDLVNSEVWYKGVRYSVHDLDSMGEDQKLPVKTSLDKRGPAGDARNRYIIKNADLLRYDGRPRGILTLKAPKERGDFQIQTVEGVTFDSNIGDVRNAYQNVFFHYTGEGHHGKWKWLKYEHPQDLLSFADKLEFGFDKDGKLMEIRYGVLDEN